MDPLPRGLFGLKRRQLFTLYLLLGSLLIVVGVTAYSLRITRDLEGQNRLITEMFSDLDMPALTREFYSKFYHYDLSDSDVESLLDPALR